MHTAQPKPKKRKNRPASRTYKSPGALKSYADKRDFSTTPEPPPGSANGTGNSFVVHRHHAFRLHCDLRLERNVTLLSWAVPKGLPPRPGIKRLAVKVEDHPLEYLDSEGRIPKGE
ncbi:MAG: hypothetical protein CME26_02780 [Gemmatimonadetes bacterium]|nr:hypothetical protein [Gemmatimonadota bacterium]